MGDNTVNGNLTAAATISSDSGLLTIVGDIDLQDGNITFAGAGDITATGDIFGNAAPGSAAPALGGVTADLALWLDASDIDGDGELDNIVNGSVINTWVDKSGNGLDAALTLGDPNYTATSQHAQRDAGRDL